MLQGGQTYGQILIAHHDIGGNRQTHRSEVPDGPNTGFHHRIGHTLGLVFRHCYDAQLDAQAPHQISQFVHRQDDPSGVSLPGKLLADLILICIEDGHDLYPVGAEAGIRTQCQTESARSNQNRISDIVETQYVFQTVQQIHRFVSQSRTSFPPHATQIATHLGIIDLQPSSQLRTGDIGLT